MAAIEQMRAHHFAKQTFIARDGRKEREWRHSRRHDALECGGDFRRVGRGGRFDSCGHHLILPGPSWRSSTCSTLELAASDMTKNVLVSLYEVVIMVVGVDLLFSRNG